MNYFVLILTALVLLHDIQSQQIQIDLQSTQATLYSNNKILLKFKVKNVNAPYTINYNGIPSDWSNLRNDLVIPNISQQLVQDWTFDINITDSQRNSLYQTVKLSLNKYQVMLFPVTLPIVQKYYPTLAKSQTEFATTGLFNLTDLINRYPGLKQGPSSFNIDYNANSIITPQLILNAQATYNPARDSKQITQFDLKKNAAINRQLNAAKAIANLLTIIDRLTQSISIEKYNIQTLQKQLKIKKEEAFNCSQQIFKIDDTVAKINNALLDRKTKLSQSKMLQNTDMIKLKELKANESQLRLKIQSVQKSINPKSSQFDVIDNKVAQCKSQSKLISVNIENMLGQIKSNNIQINSIKDDISDSNRRLNDSNQSLRIVRVKITDLKTQLKEAENLQQSIIKDQLYYSTIPIQGRTKIDNLQSKNRLINDKIKELDIKNKQSTDLCEQQQKESLNIKQKILQNQDNYNQWLSLINGIKKNIQQVQSDLKQYSANQNNLNLQINALALELQKYPPRRKQQSYLCSVTQEEKRKKQIKISQQNNKIQLDSGDLANANQNLQRARAEKELADLGVQEYIDRTASVTSYSIVPNGGSTILGGSPLGNNPSGAALGPAFRVDTIEKGILQINNLSTYLSTAYGMNIDPINLVNNLVNWQKSMQSNQDASNSALYPLDIESRNQIVSPLSMNSGLSSFSCASSNAGPVQTISGILEQVTLGSLTIRDNLNRKYTLSISSCTKILSTKPNNILKNGTKIFFTGAQMFGLNGNTLYNAYTILSVPS